MAAPTKIVMPRRDNGSQVPNPVRWMCDQGHIHPSRPAAIKCNAKHRRPSV
jgi:hypothetical protein